MAVFRLCGRDGSVGDREERKRLEVKGEGENTGNGDGARRECRGAEGGGL